MPSEADIDTFVAAGSRNEWTAYVIPTTVITTPAGTLVQAVSLTNDGELTYATWLNKTAQANTAQWLSDFFGVFTHLTASFDG